ncbi:MAG: YlbF family regulator [Peptococcaceae bacterium]|nr:YlbF family regulator [Peptococcaceae bacterium]
MDHITKARELGSSLAACEEFSQLKTAEAEIQQDAEAWKAFQGYQSKEQALTASKLFGTVISEKDALAHIDHKVRLMNRYPTIRHYFTQQQTFEKLMATVNLAITTSLYGMPNAEDLPLPESLKGLAQQVLNTIADGADMNTMEIPTDLKLPFDLKNLS